MNWQFIVVAATLSGTLACKGEEIGPELRVVAPGTPLGTSTKEMPADLKSVAEGQALLVLHRLPDEVALDEAVHVLLETPCTAVERDVVINGQDAISVFVAPPGASCSLIVTATVSNSTRVVRIEGSGCASLTDLCVMSSDAAVDSASGDSAVDSSAGDAETGD
jgi:hypothetical protein